MTFDEAANHVLTFGKYKGMRIDDIAATDTGLKYLDWFRGTTGNPENDRFAHTRQAVGVYCDHPTIAREIAKLIED
jgi:hypothetical protein